ncbi:MAG TPA: hypothetical protein VF587_04770, partial [Solirubrobacteraceae bacterium]
SGVRVRTVMAAAGAAWLPFLLLGITSMAGEFRHGTAATTFLVSPLRHRAFRAKVAALALAGLVVGAMAIALTLAVAVPWYAAEGVALGPHLDDVTIAFLGSLAVTALAAVMGVGLGAALRNQTAAVTAALVWSVVVESLAAGFLPELSRWLPGAASTAATGSASIGDTLGVAGGLLLSLAYAVAFALVGRRLLLRKDLA